VVVGVGGAGVHKFQRREGAVGNAGVLVPAFACFEGWMDVVGIGAGVVC
jgi:hypothetical protein